MGIECSCRYTFWKNRKRQEVILAYILAGIVGFGVFAGYKSGTATLLGPTGGYIIGFLATVFIVGYMIERVLWKD